jgi:hypothetical protein
VKKTRAAAVAVLGLALSATVAYAARPNHEQTNVAQVTKVDPSESPEASEAPDPSESPEASESPDGSETPDGTTSVASGAQGEHGAAVSAVAQDKTAVGGTNNNHGGAVSAVARGDHGTAATATSKTHGKSGAHRH